MTNIYHLGRFGVRYIILLLLLALCFYLHSFAAEQDGQQVAKFLPVEQAFEFSGAFNNQGQATIHVLIKSGYYLYRDRISFSAVDKYTKIGDPLFPAGIEIMDPFQNQEMIVFPENTRIVVPYETTANIPRIKVDFQGCARAGLCYPPTHITLALTKKTIVKDSGAKADNNIYKSSTIADTVKNKYFSLLAGNQSIYIVLFLFFIAGILLAFTPCVLPMIPILSATLASSVGNRSRTILLTLTYIFAMSITYALAGVLVGMFGETFNLQAALQSPWVISIFALLFLLLALSMFGFYQLQLPLFIRGRLQVMDANMTSNHKGSLFGAGLMGLFSALVVSPCITAPLVGALLYISSTQNALLGGVSLFFLGLGMGVPLFFVGLGLGQFVPKSGLWMERVKHFFGVLMVGIAIWLITRILAANVALLLWGIYSLAIAMYCLLLVKWKSSHFFPKNLLLIILGLSLLLYAVSLVIGGLMGNSSLLKPLQKMPISTLNTKAQSAEFISITDPSVLIKLQQQAVRERRPLLLDFYADWCESCKRMDHNIFDKTEMASLLTKFTLVRFDITQTTGAQMKLMNALKVFGAPTIILYSNSGKEVKRQVGEVSLEKFKGILQAVLDPS